MSGSDLRAIELDCVAPGSELIQRLAALLDLDEINLYYLNAMEGEDGEPGRLALPDLSDRATWEALYAAKSKPQIARRP